MAFTSKLMFICLCITSFMLLVECSPEVLVSQDQTGGGGGGGGGGGQVLLNRYLECLGL